MLASERLYPLAEAARILSERTGLSITYSQVWRWARQGVRGHRLEVRRLGRQFVTSIEALDEFAEKLAADEPAPRARKARPSSAMRRASIEAAERQLDEEGI